ncbi:polyamine ABC transporter substrate-binding protein [Stappia sp.]|uniref:polyamine ABC transporter substrate-binding protein n=1 Tax=Stappia sp. TaxID=1870903 RepID=UPI0032D99358
MKKLLCAGVAMAAVLAATSVSAQERTVRVYNWSDYIDESILEDFTRETGIKVVYDVFDSNEILETKLLAGGTGYDVVVPTGTFLGRQIQAGVFGKLDKSKLENIDNLWPQIMQRIEKFDPGNEHAINYMWGTTGIGYNVEMIKERMPDAPVDSWDMIFDPEVASKFADCGIHLLDTADEMYPAALNYLGLDPDSNSTEDFEKATELLLKIRPYIQKFHSSEYINALANGDICLAVGWSGDVLQARDRAAEADNGVTVAYSIPKEGAMMWFDNMAIPADAPHPEEAHIFLDYIMRPEVIARATNYVFYANGNLASKEFVDPDVLNDPAVYPSDATVDNLFTTTTKAPRAMRVRTREWTKVKTGQ